MTLYTTTIIAINPKTGCLAKYVGPNIPGISFGDAQDQCDNNGMGYCLVDGVLVEEIPLVNGMADFTIKRDYYQIQNN